MWTKWNIILLMHDGMSDTLAPLYANGKTPFQAWRSTAEPQSRFPIHISCCCKIPGAEYMSAVNHVNAVRISYVWCPATMDAVQSLQSDRSRIFLGSRLARSSIHAQTIQMLACKHLVLPLQQNKLIEMKSRILLACFYPHRLLFSKRAAFRIKHIVQIWND